MNVSETIKTRTSLRVYDDRMIADSDLDSGAYSRKSAALFDYCN